MKKRFREYIAEQDKVVCPICVGNKYAPEGSQDQCKLCKGTGEVAPHIYARIKELRKKIGRKLHAMAPNMYKNPDEH